jgi:two-component system chemotaxis response regulator CheB
LIVPRLRVLVVDDSVVLRRVLVRELSRDPDIEVIATAPNGRVALAKVALAVPDLITLDVEMPAKDGLKTLAALRRTHPLLPVIMFSAFSEPALLDEGLAFKAVDYVLKPPERSGGNATLKVIREDLLPRIKGHLARKATSHSSNSDFAGGAISFHNSIGNIAEGPAAAVEIVVVGVSTGGPDALAELLPCFPQDFPVPILIVQHIVPAFTKILADRLASKSRIRVLEAVSDQLLMPAHAWLAPGGSHMLVEDTLTGPRIQFDMGPPENSCRPSVDVLFRSVAKVYGSHVLAVMMTGMGQDGFEGCKQIHQAGGRILVQDESSSVVWGMPRFVIQAGIVDRILPLRELGPEIVRRVMERRKPAPRSVSPVRIG